MKKAIWFWISYLVGLLFVSSTVVPLQSAIPPEERAALIALYNATNGDSWNGNSGWKDGILEPDGFGPIGSEGSWVGITVSNDSVTRISLSLNNLTGSIPAELGNLSNLQTLWLNDNQLNSNLPKELGDLSNLQTLWLKDNQLSGCIPSELGNLSNLEYLNLRSNRLTGNIPSSLINLTNLSSTYTDIGYNGLYTDVDTLRTFLNSKDPDWENTQTIAPSNVSAAAYSTSSVTVSWTPITYTWDTGGYEIYYSLVSGGPWTYAGITFNKSMFSYNVTGLVPGAVYYFVIKTRTNPHSSNANTVVSEYSEEVSAATHSVPGTHTLTVLSSPGAGVSITVTPNDNSGKGDGATNFARYYNEGTTVTLKAAPVYNGKNFLKWRVDGDDNFNRSIQVTMDGQHTVTAIYQAVTPTRTLTVQSTPNTGVPITVSPHDNNGDSDGNTNFTRTYNINTVVTITAPETFNDTVFSKWTIDKGDNFNCTIKMTMDGHHTVTAVYQAVTPTHTLIVQSTPSTGVPITVSPHDNNGEGDGNTNFTRTYNIDTVVTLTAPETFNDKVFYKWTIDGFDHFDPTIQVTMDGNHSASVVYRTLAGIVLSRNQFNFGCDSSGISTGPQSFFINNSGESTLNWTVSDNASWYSCSPTSGINSGEVTVSVNASGLSNGTYNGTITVSDPNASNSPQTVDVTLVVYNANTTDIPFGYFETPLDSAYVYSSIPVTGWALDDIEVENVKIYREEGSNLIFIGAAVFVEGARPDVEQAYPNYPKCYQAGWGYMMLTNFLPNGGNGTFTLHAIATDNEGNQVTLGTKTIFCDNAHAVRPFGAIDSPAQGGTASGSDYRNQGWVLTPPPNKIPEDGHTINVWIDSVNLGNPTYNIYRADIATLFPGYANSEGAMTYFDFDTTAYENGVHTIHWTAIDNVGNVDGVGSRYFNILNEGTTNSVSQASNQKLYSMSEITKIPVDCSGPVNMTKGYNANIEPETVYPDEKGNIAIEIKELERIVIHLNKIQAEVEEEGSKHSKFKIQNSKFYSGYLLVGQQLWPLPIGSTMDSEKGIFYWQPGPGFIGEYQLVFVEKGPDEAMHKKLIKVKIVPKFGK